MEPVGQLQYYRSKIDGKLHPYAVCATDTTGEPKPLVVEVSPGAISDLARAVSDTEELARIAARHGHPCVVMRPTGRGPGSVYQNYGEVDPLEAIEHVASNFAIDRDRISVTGASMGGAAVWYLISHYPDLFSAAAPFCGYCDYRLWEKPGGLHFGMWEWEEPSWRSRSAAFLVENLRHTPVWIVHGEWDRAVGAGVPVEHSRRMARLMAEKGFTHTYTELPRTGHGCRTPEMLEKVVPWLLEQRKPRDPRHVSLATYGLRHNRSYWVAVDQLERYGERGLAEARVLDGGRVTVSTDNVRTLSLGPFPGGEAAAVAIDGAEIGEFRPDRKQTFRRSDDGVWQAGDFDLSTQKRRRASGPIGDLFFDAAILVPGTTGTDEETHISELVARNNVIRYRSKNGGVHRGGIPGENNVELRVARDAELSDADVAGNNLVLYGTYASNSVLARFDGRLPLEFDGRTVRVAGRCYTAERAAVFAVFPHPENPERYVAVHGGVTPDAIAWDRFDMNLLPDYVVYSGGELLDWGFWSNDWRSQR